MTDVIQHVDISDPFIHEPKDITTAAGDTVYIADGTGSGEWAKVGSDQLVHEDVVSIVQNELDLSAFNYVTSALPDIAEPESVIIPLLVPAGKLLTVLRVRYVLGVGMAFGSNKDISVRDGAGNLLGTATTIIASGSAEGDSYTFTATQNNEFTSNNYLKISSGGGTVSAPLYLTVEFTLEDAP